jgi:hypothetical protein
MDREVPLVEDLAFRWEDCSCSSMEIFLFLGWREYEELD